MKTQDMLLNPARVSLCYERSRQEPIREMLHQEQLRSRRASLRTGGWNKCLLCAKLTTTTVMVHSHRMEQHCVQHRLYAALGIEDTFVSEEARKAQKRFHVLKVHRAFKGAIAAMDGDTPAKRELDAFVARALTMTETQRKRLSFVTAMNLGPILIIPESERRWMRQGLPEPLMWAYSNCKRLGKHLLKRPCSVLFAAMVPRPYLDIFRRRYRVAAVVHKRVSKFQYGLRQPLRLELYELNR